MGKSEKYYCDQKNCNKEVEPNSFINLDRDALMEDYGRKRMYLCGRHAEQFFTNYNVVSLEDNYLE